MKREEFNGLKVGDIVQCSLEHATAKGPIEGFAKPNGEPSRDPLGWQVTCAIVNGERWHYQWMERLKA